MKAVLNVACYTFALLVLAIIAANNALAILVGATFKRNNANPEKTHGKTHKTR